MEELLFLFGRLLFGGYFVMNAINHFTKSSALVGYAASKGVPQPKLAVFGSGVLLAFGGLGVMTGVWVEYALWALVVFLVVVSFKMHNYWSGDVDPGQKMPDMVNFTKNMALLGAVLMLFITTQYGDWIYSLTNFF